MPERAKTGNVLLDAWIDALAPFTPTDTSTVASPISWERMFLGKPAGLPVAGFDFGPGATARVAEVWTGLAQRSFGVIAALGSTSNAGDPLGEALEQSFGVMGDVGGAAAEIPALLAEATKASTVLCAARETYRVFMMATWQRAFEEVMREAMRRAGEGNPVSSSADWLSLSNAVADRVFVEAFHSPPYLDVQRQLSSALADQRRSETNIVESFARFGHFPTRRAFDELSEEVNELRRRIRRLERARGGSVAKRKQKGKAQNEP